MHLHLGHFVGTQYLIVMKVALLDLAVLDGNRAMQRCRQAEYNGTLYLRFYRQRVDHQAAIDSGNNAMYFHLPLFYRYFGHICAQGAIRFMASQTARPALWQCAAPTCLFGDEIQGCEKSRISDEQRAA